MEIAIWKTHKRLLLCAAGAFAVGAVSALILSKVEPGGRADWIAAAGTWVIGYGAIAIAWRAGQHEETERRESREKSRKDEFASLFGVLSVARRSVDAAENVLEYFQDKDETRLPPDATLWVLSRLISRLEEARSRDLALSVLSESDQELIFDMEEEASWLRAVATDFAKEINTDREMMVKDHFAVGHIVDAATRLKRSSELLIESTMKRRAKLSSYGGSHPDP